MNEFTIENYSNTFRFTKLSPVKLLALQTSIDFDDFDKSEKLFKFILEHTEVNIAGIWQPVKATNNEAYLPVGIDEDLSSLMMICTTFMNDVVKPLFTKSRR